MNKQNRSKALSVGQLLNKLVVALLVLMLCVPMTSFASEVPGDGPDPGDLPEVPLGYSAQIAPIDTLPVPGMNAGGPETLNTLMFNANILNDGMVIDYSLVSYRMANETPLPGISLSNRVNGDSVMGCLDVLSSAAAYVYANGEALPNGGKKLALDIEVTIKVKTPRETTSGDSNPGFDETTHIVPAKLYVTVDAETLRNSVIKSVKEGVEYPTNPMEWMKIVVPKSIEGQPFMPSYNTFKIVCYNQYGMTMPKPAYVGLKLNVNMVGMELRSLMGTSDTFDLVVLNTAPHSINSLYIYNVEDNGLPMGPPVNLYFEKTPNIKIDDVNNTLEVLDHDSSEYYSRLFVGVNQDSFELVDASGLADDDLSWVPFNPRNYDDGFFGNQTLKLRYFFPESGPTPAALTPTVVGPGFQSRGPVAEFTFTVLAPTIDVPAGTLYNSAQVGFTPKEKGEPYPRFMQLVHIYKIGEDSPWRIIEGPINLTSTQTVFAKSVLFDFIPKKDKDMARMSLEDGPTPPFEMKPVKLLVTNENLNLALTEIYHEDSALVSKLVTITPYVAPVDEDEEEEPAPTPTPTPAPVVVPPVVEPPVVPEVIVPEVVTPQGNLDGQNTIKLEEQVVAKGDLTLPKTGEAMPMAGSIAVLIGAALLAVGIKLRRS